MTDQEYGKFMNKIVAEFETLGKKLTQRGLLAQEWKRDLIRLPFDMAEQALHRWLRRYNAEPSLERFMTLVDEIQEENTRHRYRERSEPTGVGETVGDLMSNAVLAQPSENDMLWAALHAALATRLMEKPRDKKEQVTRETYAAIEREYPQFRLDCLNALADLGVDHEESVPF